MTTYGKYVVETESTHKRTMSDPAYIATLRQAKANHTQKQMEDYLSEYLTFQTTCRNNKHIENTEIPMLWKTWCGQRDIQRKED